MKVIHFAKAQRCEPEPGWERVSLCNEPRLSIEYFVKPPGHASPMHEHPQEQVTIVLKGKMVVANGAGEEAVLEEGDAAYFPAHEPHMIKNPLDEPSIGVDIFHPGRPFDFWLRRTQASKESE